MITDAIVLAGGKGTRAYPVTKGKIPKALLTVLDRPFIDYKLMSLSSMGIERVVLLVGDGGDQIESHVGDGENFELEIVCINDGNRLLGTAGAVRAALNVLPERFWLTYGDSIGFANLRDIERTLDSLSADAVMTVLRNEGRWDRSNVHVEGEMVASYRSTPPEGGYQWIDYGLLLLPRSCFEPLLEDEEYDLSVVLKGLVDADKLGAVEVTERFWEIGTPNALAATEAHFADIGMGGFPIASGNFLRP